MHNPYQPPAAQIERDIAESRPDLLSAGFYCALAVLLAEIGICIFVGLGRHSLLTWLTMVAVQVIYALLLACAFSGHRWARITMLVCSLAAVCAAVLVVLASKARGGGAMTGVTPGLGAATQLFAVATLFAPSSRAWFKSRQ
jgi:hypothetical protein